jgi:hypothetical protein
MIPAEQRRVVAASGSVARGCRPGERQQRHLEAARQRNPEVDPKKFQKISKGIKTMLL